MMSLIRVACFSILAATAGGIPNDGLAMSGSGASAMDSAFHQDPSIPVPSSPQCWLNAVELFENFRGESSLSSALCSKMTADEQKILALELARCHLEDVGRSICTSMSLSSKHDGFRACLMSLTDKGLDTYTHFYSYVNQLCVRLLQEVVAEGIEKSGLILAGSSRKADDHMRSMINQMEAAEMRFQTMQEQQEQMIQSWGTQGETYDRLLEEARSQAATIAHEMNLMQENFKREQEKWSVQLREQQEIHAAEMLRQKKDLQEISNAVANTSNLFRPCISGAYKLYEALLFSSLEILHGIRMFGVILVFWVLSIPRKLRYLRWYLLFIVITQVLLECSVKSQEVFGSINNEETIEIIREIGLHVPWLFYTLGLIRALIWRSNKDPDIVTRPDENNEDTQAMNQKVNIMDYHRHLLRSERSMQALNFRYPPQFSAGHVPLNHFNERCFGRSNGLIHQSHTDHLAEENQGNYFPASTEAAKKSQIYSSWEYGNPPTDFPIARAGCIAPTVLPATSPLLHSKKEVHYDTAQPRTDTEILGMADQGNTLPFAGPQDEFHEIRKDCVEDANPSTDDLFCSESGGQKRKIAIDDETLTPPSKKGRKETTKENL